MQDILKHIRAELIRHHDPARAEKEKAYLKSPFRFYGVNVPTLRKIAKQASGELAPVTHASLIRLVKKLWASEFHQERSIAIFMLALNTDLLSIKDMALMERMMGECTGWDHLDSIATGVVSQIIAHDSSGYKNLNKLSLSENMWLRRASLLSQIPLLKKGGGDRELFFSLADGMLHEKEFFIRKAIGWTIRELSKSDPKAACDYLMRIKGRASGLTIREGAKRLPDKLRKKIL